MIRKIKRILIWSIIILFVGYGFWKHTYVMLLLLGIFIGIGYLLIKLGDKLEKWTRNIKF
jgi:uncharacterized membrane protein